VQRFVPGRHRLVMRFVPGRHRLVQRFVPGRHILVQTITRHFQNFLYVFLWSPNIPLLMGVTARMKIANLCFCHFLASEHLIFKIIVPASIIKREL
jgi:hypothetical protein